MSARRKKRKIGWIVFLIILLMASILFVWQWILREEARAIRYAAFGIDIPDNYVIHGIDVSHYQGQIHWPAVKNMKIDNIKLEFAVIKATEGIATVDEHFNRNWRRAQKAGITKGAYHFFLPTKSGQQQANFFIKQVELNKGDLPPVIDIEQLYGVPPAIMRREVKAWLTTVEKHYGIKPFIYSNAHFYENYLGKEFETYPLWVAHYFSPTQPRINRSWTFWQHSEQGRVNGILPKVDFNVFNGDSLEFKDILIP